MMDLESLTFLLCRNSPNRA